MLTVPRFERDALLRFLAVAVPALTGATVAIAVLQDVLAVENPSALYLLAVVATAVVSGTRAAAIASLLSFLLYNFFFVDPRYTLTVANLSELLNLFLLLFTGFVVGQLAARQRARAEDAIAREREARSLFAVSRELATRESTRSVLGRIGEILRDEASMDRVWITLGQERVAADTESGQPRPAPGIQNVLQRTPGEAPAHWIRVHQTAPGTRPASSDEVYRIRMDAGGEYYGSIWGLRPRQSGDPTRSHTRLLAAAADQVGQALRQDRLAAEASAAEIARQSDALKSALLQSVSHDLRTPLATIRAAAGSLRPDSRLSSEDRQASADAIDREVEYLN